MTNFLYGKDQRTDCQTAVMLYLIFNGSPSAVSDQEYQKYFQIALSARLEFLFLRCFGNRMPASADSDRLTGIQRQLLIQSMRLESARKEIKDLFNENQIRFCFFKGADLAFRVYPFPDARVMGDIDVLVHPDDEEAANDLLLRHNWIANGEYKHSHHRPCLQKKGVALEQHFALPGTGLEQMGELWNDPQAFERLTEFEYQLSPELNCCMLFNHAVRHDWQNAHYLLADIFMLLYKTPEKRLDRQALLRFTRIGNWLYPGILLESYREFLPETVLPEAEEYSEEEKKTFRYVMSTGPLMEDFDSAGKIYRTSFFSGEFWQKVRVALFEPQRFAERDAEGNLSFRYWRQKNWARIKAFFRVKFFSESDTIQGKFMKQNRQLLDRLRKK